MLSFNGHVAVTNEAGVSFFSETLNTGPVSIRQPFFFGKLHSDSAANVWRRNRAPALQSTDR